MYKKHIMSTANKSFENMATFKYFETTLTNPKVRAKISQYLTTFGDRLLAFVPETFVLPIYTSFGTLIVATICFEVLLSFTVVTSIVYNPLPAMWKS